MSGRKPAVATGQDWSVYIGNTTDADITFEAMELFGFGRGTFQQKEVRTKLSCFVLKSKPINHQSQLSEEIQVNSAHCFKRTYCLGMSWRSEVLC